MSDERINDLLTTARSQRELQHWMKVASKMRSSGKDFHWKGRYCPACGHALKIRTIPLSGNRGSTFFHCPACSWSKTFPFMMDEGRAIGERFVPGVTGAQKGRTVVVMGLDGKIKSVKETR